MKTLVSNTIVEKLDRALAVELDLIGKELRRRVMAYTGLGSIAVRPDGDTTHEFDRFAEQRLLRVFESSGIGLRFSSEESEDIQVGPSEDYVAIVDPLDGSDMLARGYPLASVAVCLFSLETKLPVLSRILEVFTDVQFSALQGVATRNGKAVGPSRATRLSEAFIVTYAATASRLSSAAFRRIVDAPPRLTLNYGGPLDIAKVGSGQCDVMLENVKGFRPRDYLAGLHFAQTAGAASAQPNGEMVPITPDDSDRVRFVVAASGELLREVLKAFAL